MFYPIGFTVYPNPSAVFMKVDIDGSAVVFTGATDIGQGSTTVLQQIASEATGIPCEKITMVTSDTKYTPYDTGSVASRVTLIAGNAVKKAAEIVRDILFVAAAHKLNISIGDAPAVMKVDDDLIYLDGYREASMSIGDAARYSTLTLGKPVVACATYNPVTTVLNKENGHGKPYGSHVFATQIAIVEVDDETGEYTLEKIYAVHDCGKAINPMLLKGQIDGGIGMGVGFGCYENMVTKDGKVVNDQFTDYIVPTALDVPPIVSEIVERFDPTGPYGAKGIGEPSLLPTASAIANAIFDAVGVLITDLPITPEKVYMGLKAKKAQAK
jgi:CO/xanthine dehydrogenase Mo-binding subunit